jgi:acetate kinase
MNVLAMNSGSSSLKVKIVRFGESPKTAARVITTYPRLQQTLHE